MQVAVVCSVRNEGPFLVEWVTWYRMLGFSRIVVVTNDCTDHSPQLLDAMAAAGWLTHLRCAIPPGQRIEAAKLALARKNKHVFRADWLFVCDVDEFLVVHVGDNRVQDLISYPDRPVQGIAVNWRVFGSSGLSQWQDTPTHRTFFKAAPPDHQSAQWFKSLFTDVRAFRQLDSQGPRGFRRGRAGLVATDPFKPWVNTDGEVIPGWDAGVPESRMMPRTSVAQNVAQLNHYMIRSAESFSLKRGTPSASSGVDRYNDLYLATYNRNDMREDSALIYRARFDALHATAMALPGVARLHHQCCADYVARLCVTSGIAPQADRRWKAHMAHVTAPA
jgi:Glycosyl transferase family 2